MILEREGTTTALLAVLAHPDDESFAMGGTLARYTAAGAVVRLIYATRGEVGIPGLSPEAAGQVRQAELGQAAGVLGVREVRFLGYQDGTLAQAEPAAAVDRLAVLLDELRPRAIITFGSDGISGHPDHVTVGAWVTAAFDQAGAAGWGARLFYIAPSEATQQGCGVPPAPQTVGGPIAFVDVGPYLATKVRAAQCHASQSPPFQGDPADEATHLACHEVFRLARPVMAGREDRVLADLLSRTQSAGHSFARWWPDFAPRTIYYLPRGRDAGTGKYTVLWHADTPRGGLTMCETTVYLERDGRREKLLEGVSKIVVTAGGSGDHR